MEKLYAIMRDLLEVEYNQRSFLYILNILENVFSTAGHTETALTVNATKYYLQNLQKELKAVINKMDQYLAESRADMDCAH